MCSILQCVRDFLGFSRSYKSCSKKFVALSLSLDVYFGSKLCNRNSDLHVVKPVCANFDAYSFLTVTVCYSFEGGKLWLWLAGVRLLVAYALCFLL